MSSTIKEVIRMRRVLSSIVAVLFLVGVVACAHAQEKAPAATKSMLETIKGKIVSIDLVKEEVVIKSSKTGMEKKLKASQSDIAALKVGEMVKAKFKPGSSTVDSIKEYKELTQKGTKK